jgi:oxygen-independent coproporphyrinogen-3 oxidase
LIPAMPRAASGSPELGMYIHLPFCPARCPYCDFYALPFEASLAKRMIPAMLSQLEGLADKAGGRQLDTLYLGGGTPSMLPLVWLGQLIEAVNSNLGIKPDAEISLEANPGTLSLKKLQSLRALGVNRLSLGAQSLNPDSLKALGRLHGAEEVNRTVSQARRAGFNNLNLDLIYGLPAQSADLALNDLRKALELEPQHISLYELTLSAGTPFSLRYAYEKDPLPNSEELADFEAKALELLEHSGFSRYEVSNFARPGFECRHNQSTWRGGEYLALGPGAHGHMAGKRWGFLPDVKKYTEMVAQGQNPLEFSETLSAQERAIELIMLGLRTVEGVNLAEVGNIMGRDPQEVWPEAISSLQKQGWAGLEGSHIRPTSLGLSMADAAARLFL